jgi:transposase
MNEFLSFIQKKESPMKEVTVLGIDLAKAVFQIHGNDSRGKALFNRKVSRSKLLEFVANTPPCIIGMEACGGAHHWAREFEKLGHKVHLMAPQFVKSNKNDKADAEAIAEAVTRPNMRFVSVKRIEQQNIQAIHRVRQSRVKARTALINECHGLLLEYGVVLKRASKAFFQDLAELVGPESEALTADMKELVAGMIEELHQLDAYITKADAKLRQIAHQNEDCRRIYEIPGIGVITATAIIAAVPDPKTFKNGREFSAWLGLVPRQNSSGGRNVLLGISKRGDSYLRTLLVHGGRSVIRLADQRTDRLSRWAAEKQRTRGTNRAIVAVANKNARIIWAVLAKKEEYRHAA